MSKVRWGVLGCASIAHKTAAGIEQADNCEVYAVASRSLEKAQDFAKAAAPDAKCYGSYQDLLDDELVQVVYIPLPTTMKKEWVLKAAQKKKHVLCDKPMAKNLEDLREMLAACAAAGVQFMDNTMFMHNKRLVELRAALQNKDFIGDVRRVVSAFSIPFGSDESWAQSNIRMNADTEPMGVLGDLSWYCIRFSLWAFEFEEPEAVRCDLWEATKDGVPVDLTATLRFAGGRTATFDSSFKADLRQWAEVVGTKGTASLPDFVVTNDKSSCRFVVTRGGIGEKAETFPTEVLQETEVTNCVQHAELAKTMSALVTAISSGSGAPDEFWPRICLQTQGICTSLLESARSGGTWVDLK